MTERKLSLSKCDMALQCIIYSTCITTNYVINFITAISTFVRPHT